MCDAINVINANLKSVGVYSLDNAYLNKNRKVDTINKVITM